MGWTILSTAPADVRAFIKEELGADACEVVPGRGGESVAYAAIRHKNGFTYGEVALIESSGGRFAYKMIDEFAGPLVYDCPESIMSLLTPLDDIAERASLPRERTKYAQRWRQKCRSKA